MTNACQGPRPRSCPPALRCIPQDLIALYYHSILKLTLAAILLTALGLGIAVARSGHASGSDLAILVVAILCVCTFGALPVLLGNRRPKPAGPRIVVPGPDKRRPPQPPLDA